MFRLHILIWTAPGVRCGQRYWGGSNVIRNDINWTVYEKSEARAWGVV